MERLQERFLEKCYICQEPLIGEKIAGIKIFFCQKCCAIEYFNNRTKELKLVWQGENKKEG